MSRLYKFYRPWDMKLLEEGNFAGMPFDLKDCLELMEVMDSESPYNIDYSRTGLINRKIAEDLQEIMPCNKTFFTDLMDDNATDALVYRIE